MNPQLAMHQTFVDQFVKRRHGVLPRWVKEKGWPDLPKNKPINDLVSKLTSAEKDVLVELIAEAREGGMHDALVVLHTELANALRLVKYGVEMAFEPYGTEIYYDWICRCEGDNWPE